MHSRVETETGDLLYGKLGEEAKTFPIDSVNASYVSNSSIWLK